ncbi:MAG: NUDIX domain-containing protein [Bacilli bacterium]
MNKRISCRAIIIENDSIILLYRRKKKGNEIVEYYSLPGGGLEEGESLEKNIFREIKEELTIDIDIIKYLGKREDDSSIQHFFCCIKTNGIPKLGGPEIKRCCEENYYEIRFIKLTDVDNINVFYKDIIKEAIKLVH